MSGAGESGTGAAAAIDAVLDAARAAGLADERAPVVAMVSGGRDSICLLDATVALRGAPRVRALHVNYGLRPGADGAESLVAALCERLRVPLHIHRVTRPEGGGNLQAWARDARYGAATRLALGCGGVVATGHTSTDQVETVLYRLAASPGPAGAARHERARRPAASPAARREPRADRRLLPGARPGLRG